MLIMKCPSCQKYIRSVLLAEISEICCEHCGSTVPVHNVLVSSNGFTFDRNDLLKRFFRYRKLLDEVIDEHTHLHENPVSRSESKKSIEQFLQILQGMMTGARDHFRCDFDSPISCRIIYAGTEVEGFFQNLSMEGACLQLVSGPVRPKVKHSLILKFFLPHCVSEFVLSGEICWVEKVKDLVGKGPVIGIRFDPVEKRAQENLWKFICSEAGKVPG